MATKESCEKQGLQKVGIEKSFGRWFWYDASRARCRYDIVPKVSLPELTKIMAEAQAVSIPADKIRFAAIDKAETAYAKVMKPFEKRINHFFNKNGITEEQAMAGEKPKRDRYAIPIGQGEERKEAEK